VGIAVRFKITEYFTLGFGRFKVVDYNKKVKEAGYTAMAMPKR